MPNTPKARVIALAQGLNLSTSYGALLYMAALVDGEPSTLLPKSEEERFVWDGHLLGLISALHCVAMHEQHFDPSVVGEIVDSQLMQARYILRKPTLGNGG